MQANEKEREADSNAIKAAVKPLLGFQPDGGGAAVDDSTGVGGVVRLPGGSLCELDFVGLKGYGPVPVMV